MLDRLRGLFARTPPPEAKESASGKAVFMATNRGAQWSQRRYASFAEEGYRKNVVAYQAINKTADAVAAIPWLLYRRDTELEEHDAIKLLKRPNPMQSGAEFIRSVVGYYRIAGNAYVERVSSGSRVRELWALRPDRMQVIPSPTGMPKGYAYKVNNGKPVLWDSDPQTGESDIRHFKSFNPLDDWYGLSPIEAGAYAVDQHNESMTWMQSLLQNSAMPSGALESDSDITEEQFQRLKAEVEEQYSGAKNAGRPMLLEGGLKWTQMGLSPDQMQVIETKYSSARDVSLALGVPPQMLGIPGDSTYSNYQEARLAFYEESVIPLAQYIRDELNSWWIKPAYGPEYQLELDLDKIPAIADKRMELWGMADRSTELTFNERRDIKGYGPLERGGNTLMVPSNLIPVDFDLGAQDQTGAPQGDDALAAASGAQDVQDTALNGAQIQGIQAIVQSVADGTLPAESAIQLIRVSFPMIDEATARRIIDPASSFEPRLPQEERSALDYGELKALAYGYDDKDG